MKHSTSFSFVSLLQIVLGMIFLVTMALYGIGPKTDDETSFCSDDKEAFVFLASDFILKQEVYVQISPQRFAASGNMHCAALPRVLRGWKNLLSDEALLRAIKWWTQNRYSDRNVYFVKSISARSYGLFGLNGVYLLADADEKIPDQDVRRIEYPSGVESPDYPVMLSFGEKTGRGPMMPGSGWAIGRLHWDRLKALQIQWPEGMYTCAVEPGQRLRCQQFKTVN